MNNPNTHENPTYKASFADAKSSFDDGALQFQSESAPLLKEDSPTEYQNYAPRVKKKKGLGFATLGLTAILAILSGTSTIANPTPTVSAKINFTEYGATENSVYYYIEIKDWEDEVTVTLKGGEKTEELKIIYSDYGESGGYGGTFSDLLSETQYNLSVSVKDEKNNSVTLAEQKLITAAKNGARLTNENYEPLFACCGDVKDIWR